MQDSPHEAAVAALSGGAASGWRCGQAGGWLSSAPPLLDGPATAPHGPPPGAGAERGGPGLQHACSAATQCSALFPPWADRPVRCWAVRHGNQ